jgi:hypothetical protein
MGAIRGWELCEYRSYERMGAVRGLELSEARDGSYKGMGAAFGEMMGATRG